LETSNLVLLFREMFNLRLLLSGLLLFSPITFAKTKVITSDVALYRVGDEITFLSDIRVGRKDLIKFRCFQSKVLLLPALGLDKASLKTVPSINKIRKFDKESKNFLKKIILMKKALVHVEKQGRKFGKKYLKYFEKHKCLNSPFRTWSKTLQQLVTVELYFQERFKKGSSHVPIKSYDPKTWENVKFYLLSLDKKIPHNVFF